jgi:uncharacterized damage-inducible protein DinB
MCWIKKIVSERKLIMAIAQSTFPTLLDGWSNYQNLLITAIAPLSSDQLEVSTAPNLRSVEDIVLHIIGARARWFTLVIHEGGEEMEAFNNWDRKGMPRRSATELVTALETTWRLMQTSIARWTPAEWEQELDDEGEIVTRSWIIWHLIEHDVHHGGETSITLGMHGLAAPDL